VKLPNNIDFPDLETVLRDAIESLNMRERKVKDVEGRNYLFRVRPYRTTDNKIDGAVITLVYIDGRKRKTSNEKKNPREWV
jgi:two-component system CheB/CheR fusion protein